MPQVEKSPLAIAASHWNPETVRVLIDSKANIEAKDEVWLRVDGVIWVQLMNNRQLQERSLWEINAESKSQNWNQNRNWR